MKRLITLASVLLLSALLAMPALAAGKENSNSQQTTQEQAVRKAKKWTVPDSEGRRLHKAYFQKHEAMKQKRDAALKIRNQNVSGDNPGNTGM